MNDTDLWQALNEAARLTLIYAVREWRRRLG